MNKLQRIYTQSWPDDCTRSGLVKRTRSELLYCRILDTIAQQSQCNRNDLSIVKSVNGKPYVMQNRGQTLVPMDNTFISISHSRYLSVWTCQSQPCAIDIEPVAHHRSFDRLLHRLLQRIDWSHWATHCQEPVDFEAAVKRLNDDDRAILFYRLWTFCESWCKWHGQTLWKTLHKRIPFPWPSITACLGKNVTSLGQSIQLSYDCQTVRGSVICLLFTR